MRSVWKFTTIAVPVVVYLAAGWVAGLVVFALWFVGAIVELARARAAVAPTTRCPRGHEVPQYGLHRCGCGAVTESWAWRCPVCGANFGHIACPTCSLAVRNPLAR